jgi:hypothetical protein
LAKLTLGNPSVKDASNVQDIVDGLMMEYKVNYDLLKAEKASTEKDAKEARRAALEAQKKVDEAAKKFKALEAEIIKEQAAKESLERTYENALEKEKVISSENAKKAAAYDEEHTFWNAINPLHDLGRFLKKLVALASVIAGLVTVFKIAEVFFPQLNIVGAIFGLIGKFIFRFAPKAKKVAGVVSGVVWDAFKANVKALNDAFDSLKNGVLEKSVLVTIPEGDYTKADIAKFLAIYSDKVEELIKKELDEHNNEDSRAIVTVAKAETGIKPMSSKVEI